MDDKTNEVVEAMARSMAIADGKDPDAPAWAVMRAGQFLPEGICWREQYADKARAALTASEPLLAQARAQAAEDAAKVALDEELGRRLNFACDEPDADLRWVQVEIARAIRALAQSEGEGKA